MRSAGDAIILEIAELLATKQVEKQRVEQALEKICSEFSFDSGMLYEIDQYTNFQLMEYTSSTGYEPPREIVGALLPESSRKTLVESLLVSVPNENPTQDALLSLDYFNVKALVAVSIVDEVGHIDGILIFTGDNSGSTSPQENKVLTIVATMLSRYVSMRICQNRIDFAQISLERILDNTGIDIYVNDFNNHDILYVNQSMAAPYGGADKFMGNKCWQVLFPGQTGTCEFCPQKNIIDDDGNPTKVYTWDYQRPFDGSWFRVFSAAFRWVDGRLAHVVSSADITDNKRNEEIIHYMAHYDALTKLPNRRMLISDCQRIIEKSGAGESKGYLLFFDLDGFKAINDNYGHDAGDEFLVQLGEFFSEIPMLKNSIYRNGGDEFVAILMDNITRANVANLAHFIHERFKQPWILKSGSVFCNVSIGASAYPGDGVTAEELIYRADQAMYKVKKSGGGNLYFFGE